MIVDHPFVLDAIQHLIEPPDFWTSRVPSALRAQAPEVVALPDGGEAWSFAGGAWRRPLAPEVTAGHGPLDAADVATYATIRRGCFEARGRLEDLEIDGIDAAVIFPTFGLSVRNLLDPDLHRACARAYNDGLWEWVQAGDPERLVPVALVPSSGLEDALAELRRVIARGYRAIVFGGWPAAGERPAPEEDAFWALCQEAGLVVNLLGGGLVGPDRAPVVSRDWIGATGEAVKPLDMPLGGLFGQKASPKGTTLVWFIFTGILERFPSLKLALAEAGSGWIPPFIEQLDDMYRRGRFWAHVKLTYTPSDYYRRQVKSTLEADRFGVVAREDVGVDTLMWASGYPNGDYSAWPSSRLAIEAQFRGVPEGERRRMLGENCAELYGIRIAESQRS